VQHINPALLPLLRSHSALKATEVEEDRDDLAPARGILTAILVMVCFWAATGLVIWSFVKD
jgi:hypothetical protein